MSDASALPTAIPAATNPATPSTSISSNIELTPAQKKALAKAEKVARRAEKVTAKETPPTPSVAVESSAPKTNGVHPQKQKAGASVVATGKAQDAPSTTTPKARRPSVIASGVQVRDLPERLRRDARGNVGETKNTVNKEIAMFSHLYNQPRKHTLEGSAREVHPAILGLGLQLSSYVICGSQARCIAMLLALKSFITSYTTPHGTSLPRHLSTSALSPQLTHLKLSRPFSITQSNSIRWLKNLIATIDPSAPEPAAKQYIITSISTFVRERFTIADRVIAQIAGERIRDGDVILTYAKSAVVTQTLLSAYTAGKKFRVVVVDSRPLFEGKALARTLSAAGIAVSYVFTSGLTHALQDVTLCILGAHAVLGNGGVYSRVGTALVSMAAKHRGVPVCVLAESVKFTERVMLDSVVGNELAGEEEMMFDVLPQSSTMPPQVSAVVASGKGDTKGAAGKSSKLPAQKDEPLKDYDVEKRHPVAGLMKDWRERENLYVLNIMYDVMPPEHVDAIITEHGTLPPGCAPIVGRMNIGG